MTVHDEVAAGLKMKGARMFLRCLAALVGAIGVGSVVYRLPQAGYAVAEAPFREVSPGLGLCASGAFAAYAFERGHEKKNNEA